MKKLRRAQKIPEKLCKRKNAAGRAGKRITRRDRFRIFALISLCLGASFIGMWTAVIKGEYRSSGDIISVSGDAIELKSHDSNTAVTLAYSSATQFYDDQILAQAATLKPGTHVVYWYKHSLFSNDSARKVSWRNESHNKPNGTHYEN